MIPVRGSDLPRRPVRVPLPALARVAPGVALLLITVLLAPSVAAQAAAVEHVVRFPELRQQYVHVTSRFPGEAGVTELRLPTWAPGSYLQQPFDAAVDLLEVRLDGTPTPWRKVEKDTWQVDVGTAPAGDLEVRYRVLADRRSVSASWVSEDYVLLNGSSVFLYADETRDRPQVLAVESPTGLDQVATPLPDDGAGRFRARDYDELVDSPLVLSRAEATPFTEDGQDFRFLNVGDDRLWDSAQAVDDLRAMIGATHELFGEVPLERPYWFMNLLNEETGGLEHDHGTVMQASRWQMQERSRYLQWLSLAAHEYLHAWNVRRMRPVALARYDYRREQYTDSLWVAEGLTSYYDDLLLSRARVAGPSEYLERLARHIHALEQTPGRLRLSLEQASRDAWTRHYQPGANALNRNVSYYVKGAVVGFVLDARLRADSRGRRSLDDVVRLMWTRWGRTPYPESAFYEAVAEVGGDEVVDWLRPLVETVAEPDVDEAFAHFGLVLERHPVRSALAAAGGTAPAGLGINWVPTGPHLVADAVIDDGPAARAGVLAGDELLAVNGERLTREDFERKLRRLVPGMVVDLLLARQGRILEKRATLGEARPSHYEVRAADNFSSGDRRRLESWLGQPLSAD